MKQIVLFSLFIIGIQGALNAGDSKAAPAAALPINMQFPHTVVLQTSKTLADLTMSEMFWSSLKGGIMTFGAGTVAYYLKRYFLPNASATEFQQSTITTRNKNLLSDRELMLNRLQTHAALLTTQQQLLCALEQHAKTDDEKKRCAKLRQQNLEFLEAHSARLAEVVA